MNKLKLDLDALTVESFDTDVPQERGTVVGAAAQAVAPGGTYPNCSAIDACPSAWNCSVNGTCMADLCGPGDTAAKSCAGTCDFNTGCGGCSGPIC
ncbi:MAG TPA: hypothetical protein VGO40_19060 [Longimicrobium sp.]|jgi:hypothetical protein|nr:hypothetical protein [Longimicrobium sp.]